jgi:hypothetical protein
VSTRPRPASAECADGHERLAHRQELSLQHLDGGQKRNRQPEQGKKQRHVGERDRRGAAGAPWGRRVTDDPELGLPESKYRLLQATDSVNGRDHAENVLAAQHVAFVLMCATQRATCHGMSDQATTRLGHAWFGISRIGVCRSS